jgi:hypothetical protein
VVGPFNGAGIQSKWYPSIKQVQFFGTKALYNHTMKFIYYSKFQSNASLDSLTFAFTGGILSPPE